MEERIDLIEKDTSEALRVGTGRTFDAPRPDRWATASEDEIREYQEKALAIK